MKDYNKNNKCVKDYNKNKESLYLKYWDENNVYGWAMSQKLSLGGSKWVEETSQFNKDFIKTCNEDRDIGYSLEVYVQSLENLNNDLPRRMKIEKVKKRVANLHNKKD